MRSGIAMGVVLALAIVTVLGANACITGRAEDHVYETLAEVPARRWAIVLGTRINLDGTPTQALRDRIDCAHELLAAGRVQTIYVSGNREIGEDLIMHKWLVDLGVPEAKIVRDGVGLRTRLTMQNAHAHGIRDAVICTQRFHQARSIAWAQHEGIDAVGLVSNRRPRAERKQDQIREILARTLAWFEMVVD